MTDKITTHWKGNMVFESDNPRWPSIMMDASKDFGGTSSGMAPKAMMLSSLAGCSALDVISTLGKMKEEIDDFKIDVSGELTDEHPKYCGVMEMFRSFAKIETNIIYHIVPKQQ
jgi:putative redox protein